MKLRRTLVPVLFGFSCVLMLFLYRNKDNGFIVKDTKELMDRAEYLVIKPKERTHYDELRSVHHWRINRLRFQCFSESNRTHNFPSAAKNTLLHYAHNINVAFCKIPKCGSTFWMQFLLLMTNIKSEGELFGQMRVNMHVSSELLKETPFHLTENYTVFMMVRNPYSRLYSAYVDKIYLPGYLTISTYIGKKHKKNCSKDVTFEEFLLYVIENAEKGNKLDPHWESLYKSCEPCHIPYTLVAKQETYAKDAEFIMDRVNITGEARTVLSSALHGQHTNNSIQEITRVMVSLASAGNANLPNIPCTSFVEFCERLWISFCIQGYIRNSLSFPKEKFSGLTYTSVNEIIDIYLEYAAISRLTARESHLQRLEYLHNAYKNISTSTMRKIQTIYRLDFELFGYDFRLPGF